MREQKDLIHISGCILMTQTQFTVVNAFQSQTKFQYSWPLIWTSRAGFQRSVYWRKPKPHFCSLNHVSMSLHVRIWHNYGDWL